MTKSEAIVKFENAISILSNGIGELKDLFTRNLNPEE